MSLKLQIPEELGDKDLTSFFKGWNWMENPVSPVNLSMERGTHISPWAATLFGAYAIWLKEVRGKEVNFLYDNESYLGQFLIKIGLPALLGESSPSSERKDEKVFPITRIRESKEIAPIAISLMELLDINDAELEAAIKYSIIELLRNVVQHSESQIGGFVSALYLPKSGLVNVVVADVGCGIKETLHCAYPEIDSDQKAVRFAMQPHVSGTFQSGMYQNMKDNAGLGLFFIREIAARANGGFFLGSGRMLADIWGDKSGKQYKKYFEARGTGWRGTFALLQFRKDSIAEFGFLLEKCRDIAAEVRKSRNQLAVDFLDEKLELEGLHTIQIKEFEEDVEQASLIRDNQLIPLLDSGELLLLDFSGVRAATQSFIHALMYKIFRDAKNIEFCLTVCCMDRATEEAIRAVAAYASSEND